MLIVIVPILINKDVFETSYNDLKFTVSNNNYFCTISLEKTLMLGKIEGRRRRGRQRMRWLDGINDSMDMGLGDSGSW